MNGRREPLVERPMRLVALAPFALVACAAAPAPVPSAPPSAPPPPAFDEVSDGKTLSLPYWVPPDAFVKGRAVDVLSVSCNADVDTKGRESVTCAKGPAIGPGNGPRYARLFACTSARTPSPDAATLREVERAVAAREDPAARPDRVVVLDVTRRVHVWVPAYRERVPVPPPPQQCATGPCPRGHLDEYMGPHRPFRDVPTVPGKLVPAHEEIRVEAVSGTVLPPEPLLAPSEAGRLTLSEALPTHVDSNRYTYDARFLVSYAPNDDAHFAALDEALRGLDPTRESLAARVAWHADRALLAARRGDLVEARAQLPAFVGARLQIDRTPWTLALGHLRSFVVATEGELRKLDQPRVVLRDPCR